ncbi:DEAD/DEAH box helicase family protein [uncultured Ruminococcus sp.]|uniref:DEAD/DEAH box helicase family protein n=1 Tax=uncultured Ruminococcus sp. TaxID=165186 RepID=UPI0025CCA37B|nr:DEAD/DEAH box helicase family protein [uncultured Ruminococcus sp.]
MSIDPTGFQEAAANAAVSAFKRGRTRYLIADETGLGKTITARTVIKKMSEGAAGGKPFKVYYFGSNLMLLSDTAEKLTKGENGWETHDGPGKLGMMCKSPLPRDKRVLIYCFSANILGGTGSSSGDDISERPYYEKLLKDHADEIREFAEKFTQNYESLLKARSLKGKDVTGIRKFAEKFTQNYESLLKARSLKGEDVTGIRKFAEMFTLYHERPDLVIFDEFHRYDKSLTYFLGILDGLKKVFPKYEVPPVLLMSATPYNYYPDPGAELTSAAENEGADDNAIRSFEDLLRITAPDMCTAYEKYKNREITPEVFSSLLMENCIYRNERIYDGNLKYKTLPTDDDFKNIFARCINEERFVSMQSDVPRYFKLCSGVYSFPIKYLNNKNDVSSAYSELKKPEEFSEANDELFVFSTDHKLKRGAPYFDNLRFACIEHYNAKAGRDLLWVPPSMPEYTVTANGTFKCFENKDFTKLMIFSAYKMVPRIVSGVFSAYVSDDVNIVGKAVTLEQTDKKMQELLSGRYDESNSLYERLVNNDAAIDAKTLVSRLSAELKKLFPKCGCELLAKYVAGSPFMCAMRVFKNKDTACEIAEAFNVYFAKEGIKQAIVHNGIKNEEQLLEYCFEGGLGAVMREYVFSGGSAEEMKTALRFGAENCTKVHVYSADCYNVVNSTPFTINCHYAERFNADHSDNGKSATSKDGKEHFRSCHKAFNSPFWPMILCTTSANQEGYDLDRYCHRIMHYSLPPNTMSFEQRDGRIDRRLSLLARRRMVQLYGSKMQWEELFEDSDDCGMSPCWTQKNYFSTCAKSGLTPLRFERIVPYFKMTDEYILYTRLRQYKNHYRSHFGLPTEAVGGTDKDSFKPLKLNKIK